MTACGEWLSTFYRNRRVLITGHTGFKGSWLMLWLDTMGAHTGGIGLPPTSSLSSYTANRLGEKDADFTDVRDRDSLQAAFDRFKPEIVFHLAAQALVGEGYEDPRTTFETNVMGTVNVLECIRSHDSVNAAVIVTSDKCYANVEQIWGYREPDKLGGDDPYSASKAATEIATAAYIKSFFSADGTAAVASARAGNVVGGGDWSRFRLVPDCVRGLRDNSSIPIRHPEFTRPWQFVLDSLSGYLMLAARLVTEGKRFAGAWNFGPLVDDKRTVESAVQALIRRWGGSRVGIDVSEATFSESRSLLLDSTKAREHLQWRTVIDFDAMMDLTAAWYRQQFDCGDGDMRDFSCRQIAQFEQLLSQAVRF